jgi:hypothetical protein
MKMLIASWSDDGSKSLKGFYAETMGFLNDGRGLITREKSKAGARRGALERILVFLTVGRESKRNGARGANGGWGKIREACRA